MNKNKNWKLLHEETLQWARWIALYEAVQFCAEKAEDKGIPFDKVDLKPLKLLEYMDSVQDIIIRKLLKQEHNIDVYYSEPKPKNEYMLTIDD